MYKKFLGSMLLMVVLAGCGHQSSDKQGDQTDTALPVQDQITNPAPINGADQGQQPVGPSSTVEPTQPLPADTTTSTSGTNPTTTTPASSDATATTPATPLTDKATGKATDKTTDKTTGNKDTSATGSVETK